VGHVAGGSTDVADKLAKNWTGHDLPVTSLQVVRAVEILRLSIVEAQAAVLRFLSVHVSGSLKRKMSN